MLRKVNKIFLIFSIAFVFRFILAFIAWHPDVTNHIDWGIRFWQYGPKFFYQANVWSFTWPNQPPGTMYVFAGIRKLYEILFSFFSFLHFNLNIFPGRILLFFEANLYPALLKLPGILADLGIGWLLYSFFQKRKDKKAGLWGASLWLFNPVVWYNSSLWGQTDAVINFFALFSVMLLLERKLFWATLAILISFYIKSSLLIFLPIFVVILLRQKYSWVKILISFSVPLLLLALVSLPFAKGNVFGWLFNLYKDKIFAQQMQVITANAFNLWGGLTGLGEIPHNILLGPLSYKIWGYIFFILAYIPAVYVVFRKQDAKSVFWALSIVSFSSFMLLTNMHERYLYPLFPAFTFLVVEDKKLLPFYLGISGINLVNLYHLWWVPRFQPLVSLLSFQNRLVPRLLSLLNFSLFVYLYTRFLRLLRAAKI